MSRGLRSTNTIRDQLICSLLENTITPPLGRGWRECIVACKLRFNLIFLIARTSTLVSVSTKKSNFSLTKARRVEIFGPEPRSDSDFNPPTFWVAMLMKMSWWCDGCVMMWPSCRQGVGAVWCMRLLIRWTVTACSEYAEKWWRMKWQQRKKWGQVACMLGGRGAQYSKTTIKHNEVYIRIRAMVRRVVYNGISLFSASTFSCTWIIWQYTNIILRY